MKVALYPAFEEVFNNNALKGIFYPLCEVSDVSASLSDPLFFVSSNGIWTDGQIENDNNASDFTRFQLDNGRYTFKGDINVYVGYKNAQQVFKYLETDFRQNGEEYLSKKITTNAYIQSILANYKPNFGALDTNYFLQTFYEFSINKLIYHKTGKFGAFNQIINNWGEADESPIVYEIKDDHASGYADIAVNSAYLFPQTLEIEKYEKVGFVVGAEFFTDGNDTYLLYDQFDQRAICINHYS
ncbi:MAG: hypothetical protein ACFB0B_03950 [Thermonemataceae bacterium]